MYNFFENQISFSDNVFSIKSWIKNKFQFEESVIDKQFGIPMTLITLNEDELKTVFMCPFPQCVG